MLQEKRTLKQFSVYVLLVTCCLIIASCETSDNSCTNFTPLVSSLPTVKKPSGETKLFRRSPLDHGYVVGIGDAHRTLTPINHGASSVPYLVSSVESHSLLSEVAHVTKSELTHVVHGVSVTGQTSRHSVTKFMSFGKRDPDRDVNHDPAILLPHVTHALMPTVTHVTTSTLSEHGFTKSPTLTVVLPVAALHAKPSHGLYSQHSTLTLTPGSLTSAMFAVNHDHILTTITALAKDDLLHHLPVTHTAVQKVSTLTHDPDPALNNDASVTHITDNVLRTHKLPQIPEQQNVFRTHYGGFGVGIDFGGHGSGHGFYV